MSPVKSLEQPSAQKKDKGNEADELPPGWTIESKTRKPGSAKKVDRLYTDPITGCIFRSLKDAHRYLKTGKLGRLAIKPKKPPPEAKTCQSTLLDSIKTDIPLPLPLPLPLESETRQATSLAGVTVQSPPPQPELEPKTRQANTLSGIKDNAPPASPPQAKTRRVTRQSGIQFDSPPGTRNSRQATRSRLVNDKKTEVEKIRNKHYENADMDNNLNHNPKQHNNETEKGPATLLPREDQPPPVDVNKEELPVVNPTVSNPIDFSMNNLWTDPCTEFAVKTPLEKLWTDPCIEFAVKTLTGAIPIGEDDTGLYPPDKQQHQDFTFGNGGLKK